MKTFILRNEVRFEVSADNQQEAITKVIKLLRDLESTPRFLQDVSIDGWQFTKVTDITESEA